MGGGALHQKHICGDFMPQRSLRVTARTLPYFSWCALSSVLLPPATTTFGPPIVSQSSADPRCTTYPGTALAEIVAQSGLPGNKFVVRLSKACGDVAARRAPYYPPRLFPRRLASPSSPRTPWTAMSRRRCCARGLRKRAPKPAGRRALRRGSGRTRMARAGWPRSTA